MPRKQRFKPSRKPQSAQAQSASSKMDDRQEIHPDDVGREPHDEERANVDHRGSEPTD